MCVQHQEQGRTNPWYEPEDFTLAWLEALPSSPQGGNVSCVPDEPVESRVVKVMTSRGFVQAEMVLSESNRTGRSKAARWSAAEPFLPPPTAGAQMKAARSWWGWLQLCQVLFQLQWLEPAPSNPHHPACAAPLHHTAIPPALPGVFWVREHITPKWSCPPPLLHSSSCPLLLHK